MLDSVKVNLEWDFNTCLGDTVKEKYENLCQTINKLCELLQINNPQKWIVATPMISSVFETATTGFIPAKFNKYKVSNEDGFYYCGMFDGFLVFKDKWFPKDKILVGCGLEEIIKWGTITVKNLWAH